MKILADIKSKYAQTPLAALNRAMDTALLEAARGTKYVGEDGTTSESLPSTSKVAVGSDALTLAKITSTLELFNDADVDENEPKFWAMGPQQLSDLLKLEKLTSADYNTLKTLVPGKIATFMGFNFIVTNLLAKTTTTRFNIAWARVRSGIGYWARHYW